MRIFDISNINAPTQVGRSRPAAARTPTRWSSKNDPDNVYIYVSGTNAPSADRDRGCDGNDTNDADRENPSQWRIEVINVPLAAPQNAAIVNEPRLFANDAGAVNGLQNAPQTPEHPCATATPTYRLRGEPEHPGSTGRRRRSPTPATTSRSTRSSISRPAPAKATAC